MNVSGDGSSNLGHLFVVVSSKVHALEKRVQGGAAVGFLLHAILLALYRPIAIAVSNGNHFIVHINSLVNT
jgi:hypothetical protein